MLLPHTPHTVTDQIYGLEEPVEFLVAHLRKLALVPLEGTQFVLEAVHVLL
jgi:hypothetical protein